MKKTVRISQFTSGSATGFRTTADAALYRHEQCHVHGCRNTAIGGRYCDRCEEEIAGLREQHRLHDERESRAAMAFSHVGRVVRRGLWIPLTALVIVGLMIIGGAWAPALLEWLTGGMQ